MLVYKSNVIQPLQNYLPIQIKQRFNSLHVKILTNQSYTRQIDEVIVSHGYNREASLTFDEAIAIPKKDDYYFEGKATGETAQPGIFAAGDILSFEGKIHLLLGTFQDAANAVNSIKTYLEPTAHRHAVVPPFWLCCIHE
ncbi:Ferredoxin--NADP reductase [Lysinibacillus sphaericus]